MLGSKYYVALFLSSVLIVLWTLTTNDHAEYNIIIKTIFTKSAQTVSDFIPFGKFLIAHDISVSNSNSDREYKSTEQRDNSDVNKKSNISWRPLYKQNPQNPSMRKGTEDLNLQKPGKLYSQFHAIAPDLHAPSSFLHFKVSIVYSKISKHFSTFLENDQIIHNPATRATSYGQFPILRAPTYQPTSKIIVIRMSNTSTDNSTATFTQHNNSLVWSTNSTMNSTSDSTDSSSTKTGNIGSGKNYRNSAIDNRDQNPTSFPSGIPILQPYGGDHSVVDTTPVQTTSQPSNVPPRFVRKNRKPTISPTMEPSEYSNITDDVLLNLNSNSTLSGEEKISDPVAGFGFGFGEPSSQPSAISTTVQPFPAALIPVALPIRGGRNGINLPSGFSLPPSTSSTILLPSAQPSSSPSTQPSSQPSISPTSEPSSQPSNQPSISPLNQPSKQPSKQPVEQPSNQPTTAPLSHPTHLPIIGLTWKLSSLPTPSPTSAPSPMSSFSPTQQSPQLTPTRPNPATADPLVPSGSEGTMQPQMSKQRPTTAARSHSDPSTLPSSCPISQPTLQPSSSPTLRNVNASPLPTMLFSQGPNILMPHRNVDKRIPSRKTSQPSDPRDSPISSPYNSTRDPPNEERSGSASNDTSLLYASYYQYAPDANTTFPFYPSKATPTTVPTSQPSSSPSCQPLSRPSLAPSPLPTPEPSPSPSLQPTPQTKPIVSFSSSLTIKGIGSTALTNASIQAIVQTAASSMNIPLEDVVLESISVISTTTVLSNDSSYDTSFTVAKLRVTVPMQAFPQFKTPLELYDSVTQLLNVSVSSGNFTQKLVVTASSLGAVDLTNATISSAVSTPPYIIHPPTATPTLMPTVEVTSVDDPLRIGSEPSSRPTHLKSDHTPLPVSSEAIIFGFFGMLFLVFCLLGMAYCAKFENIPEIGHVPLAHEPVPNDEAKDDERDAGTENETHQDGLYENPDMVNIQFRRWNEASTDDRDCMSYNRRRDAGIGPHATVGSEGRDALSRRDLRCLVDNSEAGHVDAEDVSLSFGVDIQSVLSATSKTEVSQSTDSTSSSSGSSSNSSSSSGSSSSSSNRRVLGSHPGSASGMTVVGSVHLVGTAAGTNRDPPDALPNSQTSAVTQPRIWPGYSLRSEVEEDTWR